MKLNKSQNIFNVIVNANSIEQEVIQNKNGKIKHINVKFILSAKKIIVGIRPHVFLKIVSI